VRMMLSLAILGPLDRLWDLGSGDGRIVHHAANRYGCYATGVEIDPVLVAQSLERASEYPSHQRMKFLCADLWTVDFSEATVITLFLMGSVNDALTPRLRHLRSGTRIVSHGYRLAEWPPNREVEIDGHRVYRWTV